MTVFKLFGGRGTVGVRGMTVFKVLGERGTVGVRGMTGGYDTRGIRYNATRPRPALPAYAQTQPSPLPWLRLCCLVFHNKL